MICLSLDSELAGTRAGHRRVSVFQARWHDGTRRPPGGAARHGGGQRSVQRPRDAAARRSASGARSHALQPARTAGTGLRPCRPSRFACRRGGTPWPSPRGRAGRTRRRRPVKPRQPSESSSKAAVTPGWLPRKRPHTVRIIPEVALPDSHPNPEEVRAHRFAVGIGIVYAALGFGWILTSDALVHSISSDPGWLLAAQRYKGLFYVIVTAIGLMLLGPDGVSAPAGCDGRRAVQRTAGPGPVPAPSQTDVGLRHGHAGFPAGQRGGDSRLRLFRARVSGHDHRRHLPAAGQRRQGRHRAGRRAWAGDRRFVSRRRIPAPQEIR
jgi:hypothetical protein